MKRTNRKPPEPPPEAMRVLLSSELTRYSFKDGYLVTKEARFASDKDARTYFKWLDSWPMPEGAKYNYWDNCLPTDFERELEATFRKELATALIKAYDKVKKGIKQSGTRSRRRKEVAT